MHHYLLIKTTMSAEYRCILNYYCSPHNQCRLVKTTRFSTSKVPIERREMWKNCGEYWVAIISWYVRSNVNLLIQGWRRELTIQIFTIILNKQPWSPTREKNKQLWLEASECLHVIHRKQSGKSAVFQKSLGAAGWLPWTVGHVLEFLYNVRGVEDNNFEHSRIKTLRPFQSTCH